MVRLIPDADGDYLADLQEGKTRGSDSFAEIDRRVALLRTPATADDLIKAGLDALYANLPPTESEAAKGMDAVSAMFSMAGAEKRPEYAKKRPEYAKPLDDAPLDVRAQGRLAKELADTTKRALSQLAGRVAAIESERAVERGEGIKRRVAIYAEIEDIRETSAQGIGALDKRVAALEGADDLDDSDCGGDCDCVAPRDLDCGADGMDAAVERMLDARLSAESAGESEPLDASAVHVEARARSFEEGVFAALKAVALNMERWLAQPE